MKKIITILVCVLVFSAMISGVFADTPASMTITASGDSIAPGEKVTFTVSVSKLESCTSAGIILGFDSNVYELDSWECLVDSAMMPSYDATTKLLSFANQGKALEGDIFRFVLKVKDSAKAGSSNVSGTPYLRNSAGTISCSIKGASVSIGCKHSYDNGCDTTCNKCGATRTAQHSWDSGKETTKPTCTTAGTKTFTCTGCGATKTESIKATGHTYTNSCDATCNSCGTERTITHTYNSKWSSDGSQHWHACTVCGAKKDEAKHIPGAEPTEKNPQTCTECGYVIKPALGHTHTYGDDWAKDVIGHWHECTGCDEIRDFENHVYENDCDTTCDTCGHIRAAEHMYTEDWSADEDGHWHECTLCGDQLEKETHVPGPEATPETPQICIVCGFELTPMVGHTHEYNWKSDDESHWQQCACGHTVGETAEHIWDQGVITREPGKNQTGIKTYTCICGQTRTEEIPAVDAPEETEPSVIQPNAEQTKDGSVTIPGWLLLAACVGIVALCALFLIIGMIIGRKQGQRYID